MELLHYLSNANINHAPGMWRSHTAGLPPSAYLAPRLSSPCWLSCIIYRGSWFESRLIVVFNHLGQAFQKYVLDE